MTEAETGESAEALAAAWMREADEHERTAAACTDRFQAAAHLGLAEDLRARAAQTLSETEAGRKAAAAEAERVERLAAAEHAHTAAVARYRDLLAQVSDVIDEGAAVVVDHACRLRALAAEVHAAEADAKASVWGVNAVGGNAAPLPNHHSDMIRELMQSPRRAAVWSAARTSTVSAGVALAELAGYVAELEGRNAEGRL